MIRKLIAGFRPTEFRPAHALFEWPTRGRGPATLLIGCADFGVDPYSLIPTNTQNLYVLQNFGNLAGAPDPLRPAEANAVEAALALYPIRDVVVCGHSPCGVMKTLVADDPGGPAAAVAGRLHQARKTREIVSACYGRLRGEPLLTAAAQVNVLVQLENLRECPGVASRLDRGDLHLHGWVYASNAISAYDPHQGLFIPLAQ